MSDLTFKVGREIVENGCGSEKPRVDFRCRQATFKVKNSESKTAVQGGIRERVGQLSGEIKFNS